MAQPTKRRRRRAPRNDPEAEYVNRLRFVNLPLDVLMEIFLFLQPAELLYLSRTTKWLRAFLLDRSRSRALWESAIENVGLPPCPHWTSPPAYAFLAFDPVCHGCYRTCETIEWELRMRCCRDCHPNMTTDKYCSTIGGLNLPFANGHNELMDEGSHIHLHVAPPYSHPAEAFSRSDWESVRTSELSENRSLEYFVGRQNEFWEFVRLYANLCRGWERGWLEKKADRLVQARTERVEDIKSKLTGMGYPKDIVSFCNDPAFWLLPEVKKFERVTPREWRKIHPRLVRWLEDALYAERKEALEHIIKELDIGSDPSVLVQPQEVDIAVIPEVRSVLEPYMALDMTFLDLRKKLRRMLRRKIRQWSTNAVEELQQMARKELDLHPQLKPSSLLPVIFRCKTCRQGLIFDEALSHDHLYKARPESYSTRRVSLYDRLLKDYPTYPRDIQRLRVDVVASRRVENLVRQLGGNPNGDTYDQMTQSNIKVVCSLCRSKAATGTGFEDAFQHCLDNHPRKKETEVWTSEL